MQSFVESLALAGAVAATGFAFSKINKIAGYVFIPYFVWCSYASLLNFVIYKHNPEQTATIEAITEGSWKFQLFRFRARLKNLLFYKHIHLLEIC